MPLAKLPIGIPVRYTPQIPDVRAIALMQAREIWVLADVSAPDADEMHFACKMPDGTLKVVAGLCRDFTPL